MRRSVIVVGVLALLLGARNWPGPGVLISRFDDVALAAFWLLLAAAALALTSLRALRLLAVPVAAAGIALGAHVVMLAVATGLPSGAVGVFAAGGTVCACGSVARAWPDRVTSGGTRSSARWRLPVAVVGALVLVGGLATAGSEVVWNLPVVSQIAAGGEPTPPVVGRPDTLRWTWTDPVSSHTVLPAGGGVVVARDDGIVVGLDGRTGRPRWWAGRAGSVVGVSVTSDRRTVVLEQTARRDESLEGGSRGSRIVVLDADTGLVRWERSSAGYEALSDQVVAFMGPGVSAYSVDDGRPLWTAPSPGPGCYLDPYERRTTPDVVVAVWSCSVGDDLHPRETLIRAFDNSTGALRWQHTDREFVADEVGATTVDVAPDGRFLAWGGSVRSPRSAGGPPTFRVVIDSDTGVLQTLRGGDTEVLLPTGSLPLLRATRPSEVTAALGSTGPVPIPVSRCGPAGADLAVVATRDAVVRLCRDGSASPPLLQVDDGPVRPLPIDPGGRDLPLRSLADVGAHDAPAVVATPAPGAFVLGVPHRDGTTLVGLS